MNQWLASYLYTRQLLVILQMTIGTQLRQRQWLTVIIKYLYDYSDRLILVYIVTIYEMAPVMYKLLMGTV